LRLIKVVLLACLAVAPATAEHPKTDIVTTNDGSTIYGEILNLQYAALHLKTDIAGTLEIEWRKITGIVSEFEYQVELAGGDRIYGSLESPDEDLHLKIVGSSGSREVLLSEVVGLAPIEQNIMSRVNGSISAGLTYTQANEALQYNLGLDSHYRDRKYYVSLNGSSIFNDQQDAEATEQSNLALTGSRVRTGRYGPFVIGQWSSNPTQGYDSRWNVGGGITRLFVETSAHLLAINLGLVKNYEEVTDSQDEDDSTELLTSLSYRRYKATSHSPAIETGLQVYTDIDSSTRRTRANLSFTLGWKVVHDFTINFQVSNSYDSEPPGEGASKNNFVIVTSLGYRF
jgi:putative salt-induced outer membrane protein YdiY